MKAMNKATFFHAGCPVCVSAEQNILSLIDASKFNVEVVHLGEKKHRLIEAQEAGVLSVPALVLDGQQVLHINHGADLKDLLN